MLIERLKYRSRRVPEGAAVLCRVRPFGLRDWNPTIQDDLTRKSCHHFCQQARNEQVGFLTPELEVIWTFLVLSISHNQLPIVERQELTRGSSAIKDCCFRQLPSQWKKAKQLEDYLQSKTDISGLPCPVIPAIRPLPIHRR